MVFNTNVIIVSICLSARSVGGRVDEEGGFTTIP